MAEFTSKEVVSSMFSLFWKDFSLSTPQSVIYIYYRDIEQILLSSFGVF